MDKSNQNKVPDIIDIVGMSDDHLERVKALAGKIGDTRLVAAIQRALTLRKGG